VKRFLDITITLISLLVLFIPICLLTLLVIKKMGFPILFSQTRPGLNGKPFRMIKFRTMNNLTDLKGELLSDKDRLSNFGKWLRSTSLDELPELWNVLKGNMSLVGPRPLLMEYLPLYSPDQFRRHDLKPGITGWAQINGRNSISWDKKFELDLWYIENQSINLDLKILWLTIISVITRSGVQSSNHVTMPKFNGSENVKDQIKS
jgi:lipopolysaccharide/colanic/teichoic acid biosynthesis glycosyltransferase